MNLREHHAEAQVEQPVAGNACASSGLKGP